MFLYKIQTRGPWATSLTWKNSLNQLTYIITIIYFLKIKWFFNWTSLNPLQTRMHCTKFSWNWPSGLFLVTVFSLFCNYISPWKKVGSFIWTVEIGRVVLEKNMKMWKVYDKNDDNDNDDGNILIRKAHLSLRLRWAKNGMMYTELLCFINQDRWTGRQRDNEISIGILHFMQGPLNAFIHIAFLH